MIDERNVFDKPVKNDLKTFDNIKKTATGQDDKYPISYLLDYSYFKENYKQINCNRFK